MSAQSTPGILQLIEKALHDPAFANLLKSNPEEAMKQLGIQPSSEKQAALKDISSCIENAHRHFGGQRPD